MHKGTMKLWDEPDAVIGAYTEFLGVKEGALDKEDI
jgi:hypothetical protein